MSACCATEAVRNFRFPGEFAIVNWPPDSDEAPRPSMRPSRLDPLFASLTSLPGIGPKLEKLFARLFGRETPRIADLLFHLPTGTIDRRARPKLREVEPGTVATVLVTID